MTKRNATLWIGTLASVLTFACGGGGTTAPTPPSLSAGQWNGTTAQGTAITFTVSSDDILTTLSVGHRFNGCSGAQTFSNLNVPTAPNVTCTPGPCSAAESAYRALHFSTRSAEGSNITVDGLFLPGNQAQGLVSFRDFPGCGTAAGVEWRATRH